MNYTKAQAKEYSLESWHGVCNVILPSFSADLKRLNEKAIRHDVRRNIALGYWGTLLVSECGTSADEYRQFMEIAADEAKGRHKFLMHGTFDTPDDIVAMAKAAESIGMEGMLLGHPNSFYPTSDDQLYDYLAYVCNRTELAVCLFAANHWNFARLHPSGYPPKVLVRAAELANVVAIKYEVGRPGIGGDYEFWKMIKGKRVLFSDPLEAHSPLTVEMFGMQWMGTSNFEYWGGGQSPSISACCAKANSTRRWRSTGASTRRATRALPFRPPSAARTSSIVICGNTRPGCRATTAVRCASPS